MDPASAIIGLSASLATLSGLVIESFKSLYKAQGHFKDAPQEIGRLYRRLKEFEGLLREFRSRLHATHGAHASAVQTLAVASMQHMEEDLKELYTKSRQLHAILDSSTCKRKLLALRLRHMLTESRVAHYQQLISTHCGTLTLLLTLSNNYKLDQLTKRPRPAPPVGIQLPKHRIRETRTPVEHSKKKKSHTIQLPFGITATSTTTIQTQSEQRDERQARAVYRLTFVPSQWFSDLILQWDFKFERNEGSFPLLGLSLNPIRYNADPRLAAAVKTCDAVQIRQLLRAGLARADDHIVIRKRPMQLLDAIAPRSTSCDPKRVLETYQCLVGSEAYNNNANLTQSHAQVLIALAKGSNALLKSALSIFCAHGGSVFWYEASSTGSNAESASTILSLISRHGAGFDCLEEFVFRQCEPWTGEDLSSIDRWLLGTLAAVSPPFRRSLESYLRSYRSVFSPGKSEYSPLELFDLSRIVPEVAGAPNKFRIEFLKILVKWGTKEMVKPFFSAGLIDLEEPAANKMFPWLRLSYLGKAVRWGNMDAFEYLLRLGACPIRGLAYLSRFPDAVPQATNEVQDKTRSMILKMTNQALSADISLLMNSEGTFDHDLLLALLLRTSNLGMHSLSITDQLVQRLINDNIDYITSCPEAPIDAYILCAILLDLPTTLSLFVQAAVGQKDPCSRLSNFSTFESISATFGERSVSIKARPSLDSFSWISLAVELARPDCLRILLDSDDSLHPKRSASSPASTVATSITAPQTESIRTLESCRAGIEVPAQQRDYPRAAVTLSTWPCQIPQRLVEEQEDQCVSQILEEYIRKHRDCLGTKDVGNIWTPRNLNPASEGFSAPKRGQAPKLMRRTRSLVASMLTSVVRILQLRIWEMVVLCLTYIVTLGLFIAYS